MKTFKVFFYSLLLVAINLNAQFNNMNGQPNSGLNRNIGRSYSPPAQSTPEEINKNKMIQIDKFISKLEKELALDALQSIAIKNEVIANGKSMDNVIKAEITEEQKTKELESLLQKSELIIKSYLNKEQKVKYDLLKEENKTKDTKKKKKKKEEEKEVIEN